MVEKSKNSISWFCSLEYTIIYCNILEVHRESLHMIWHCNCADILINCRYTSDILLAIFSFLDCHFATLEFALKFFCFNGNSYDMELLDYFTDKQSSVAEGASRAPWLMFMQRRSKTERNDTSATHTLHWIKLHNKPSSKSTAFGTKKEIHSTFTWHKMSYIM